MGQNEAPGLVRRTNSPCNYAVGSKAPGLKPDHLWATYRGLKPAATPEGHVSRHLIDASIFDAPHWFGDGLRGQGEGG